MPSRRPWQSFDQVAVKWRDLAERRRDYYVELHRRQALAALLFRRGICPAAARGNCRCQRLESQIAAETSLRSGSHVIAWREAAA